MEGAHFCADRAAPPARAGARPRRSARGGDDERLIEATLGYWTLQLTSSARIAPLRQCKLRT
jgi:hypothetical protein